VLNVLWVLEFLFELLGVFVLGLNDYFVLKLKNFVCYLLFEDGCRIVGCWLFIDVFVEGLMVGGWLDFMNCCGWFMVVGLDLLFVGVDDLYLGYDCFLVYDEWNCCVFLFGYVLYFVVCVGVFIIGVVYFELVWCV